MKDRARIAGVGMVPFTKAGRSPAYDAMAADAARQALADAGVAYTEVQQAYAGFVIGDTGKASKIRTEANTTSSAGLAKCLEQRVAEWEFPKPSGGEFELVYPFVFSAGS